jgi:AbrB family looped-hinge helix DNA binding protein
VFTVKIGVSRQIVIPKRLFDEIGLTPGDYLEVTLQEGSLLLTAKTLVDKPLESVEKRRATNGTSQ